MNQNKSIIAGILLYNPDLGRLQQNVDAVKKDVDCILFIDNASSNALEIQEFAKNNNITLIQNERNEGLPKAFNTMMLYAKDNSFGNLLLLDQDSICESNLISVYQDNISSDYVCLVPQIIHRLKEYEDKYGQKSTTQKEPASDIINSGTLINLNVLPQDIRFNENLFVDCVDFDFFLQLKKRDLKILRINSTSLFCDLGNLRVHYLFNKPFFSNNYSIFRLEKQAKDRVIFIFSHFKEPLARKVFFLSILGYFTLILFEKRKFSKLIAIFKGICKGIGALLSGAR